MIRSEALVVDPVAASFADKTVLVTGAASGIGLIATQMLSAAGARVFAADLRQSETLAELCGRQPSAQADPDRQGSVTFVAADLSQVADVTGLFDQVRRRGSLDFAFNNAAVNGEAASIVSGEVENFDRVVAVNLRSVYLCLQQEMRLMREAGGAIVNTSSMAGLFGYATAASYVASKHGVVGLTKVAAIEGARYGIRVNAVCPASVQTPLLEARMEQQPALREAMLARQPSKRFAEAAEIARTALWLGSDLAGHVTGVALPIDGGMSAC